MTSKDFDDKLLSEHILRDVLQSVTDAVVTIDEHHRVLLCNQAAEEMFGYECSEIIGQDVSPLIPPPHQDVHRGYVDRYIETGIPRVIGKSRECFGKRRDGQTFPVEISYSVSRTGEHFHFTAVIRDISKRKEMEREIRFMEKLADIGKAVAHVVHEIRKPLMLIGGFARQVENSQVLQDDSKDRHKLGIIVKEVGRLEALLNSIRILSRPPSSSQKRCLCLNEVLKETFELITPMIQDRQIDLEINLAPVPLTILGDPDQLKQVFLNLLQNSVDAITETGRICVSSRMTGVQAQIIFEDTGPGIPEDLRDKIFDPFFTTKPEGTGLGLAISRNIIQDHEGAISFHSDSTNGSTFVIEMPLQES
jgi:two-component system, LuxR family, sensor kinase FixL